MSASTAGLGPKHQTECAQKFAELTEISLFGDVWKRTQLTPRESSVATVAALVAMYRLEQLPFHLKRALDNGLGIAELDELLTHLAFYSGWSKAASALNVLNELRTSTQTCQE